MDSPADHFRRSGLKKHDIKTTDKNPVNITDTVILML